MKLDDHDALDYFMSGFHRVEASFTSMTDAVDSVAWAEDHAPGYAKNGRTFWFQHQEQALMFALRFG